jgi:hypothetical protein
MFNKDSYYNSMIASRANTKHLWHSYDVPHNYLEVNSKGPNIYPRNCKEIVYAFNNYGFRSDEFDLNSDLSILFTGCSYTEGVGLPVNSIWSNILLNRLRVVTGKNIPQWNLALSGAGLDSIANGLYWYSLKFKKKLDYIVILFPAFSRREFCYDTKDIKIWQHPKCPGINEGDVVDRLFADSAFIRYQSIKNLALIDAVSKNLNAKVIYSVWQGHETYTDHEDSIIQENFPNFQYIKYPNWKYNSDFARDSEHPGPSMHEKISEAFFEGYFKKQLYELSK